MNNPWTIEQSVYNPEETPELESVFSLANGYFGMRGFFTERAAGFHQGVFVNGFYESAPICYGEKAYGFAEEAQTMIDVPDARFMTIYLGESLCSMENGRVRSFRRRLDLARGLLRRNVTWESPEGSLLEVSLEHLISLRRLHLGATRLRITNRSALPLTVVSGFALPESGSAGGSSDPRRASGSEAAALILSASSAGGRDLPDSAFLQLRTRRSSLALVCANMVRDVCARGVISRDAGVKDGLPSSTLSFSSGGEEPVEIEKYYAYAFGPAGDDESLRLTCSEALREGAQLGFTGLAAEQEEEVRRFWTSADIAIEGDPEYQKALRFNMFQLFQSAGREGRTSLSAKGLSGNGYEGHYFWDTEIYAMPFFTNVEPDIARSLIRYRISILDRAREQARLLSEKGALFPWRTINGREASAYFPAGTAQYHINADIAYSLVRYVEITGDEQIMFEGGAELLFETARMWMSLGFFNPAREGKFCINEVTGPDEYSALVNNNFYTNVTAAFNLREAERWYRRLFSDRGADLAELAQRIGLDDEEPELWREAAEKMFIPYDRSRGIHPQDESFLDREPWDFAATPKSKYPLLLHYHPLVIYRHQVIKQADTMLAHLLLHDQFPLEQKMRDFHYYEALTTGDSSLSACIQGIAALEFGLVSQGMEHARKTAFVDLHNLQGNTRDGLHTASMAGSWMLTLYGIAGLRYFGATPSLHPAKFPENWKSLSFMVRTPKGPLSVVMNRETTLLRLAESVPEAGTVTVRFRGSTVEVGTEPVAAATAAEFRGTVFDLDGVITSTDIYHYNAWKELADAHGWRFDHEMNQRLRGVSRRGSLEVILKENGAELSEDEILALMELKNSRYRESLSGLTSHDVLPGTLELFGQLRGRGIPIAVASASRNAGYILDQLGLTGMIDYIVPVDAVDIGKPDPEIFIKAARGIGCLPDECVGFEDAPPGIEGIHAAGMKSVGIGAAVSSMACGLKADSLAQISADLLAGLFTRQG